MFNKNDPLIGPVKAIMRENDRRREAKSALMEALEIQNEKVLTREEIPVYQGLLQSVTEAALADYDTPIKEIIEAQTKE
jgi:hypothetical protein